jgi:hypothetical protein
MFIRRYAAALSLAALAFGAWWMTGPRNSWRYKMTIEVETPQGVRSGSAVRKVTYRPGGGFFIAEGRPQHDVLGDAVVVDLPNGRSLYGLLRGRRVDDESYGARIADRAMGKTGRIAGYPGPVELYPTAPKTSGLALLDPVPMLVTFADPHDSTTVERVDPHNFASTFGRGYALKRITIDIVNEPITGGIRTKLPWLSLHPERSLKPCHDSEDWSIPARLRHGDFRRGPKGEGWRGWKAHGEDWKKMQVDCAKMNGPR